MDELIQISKDPEYTRKCLYRALNLTTGGFIETDRNKKIIDRIVLWLDRDSRFNGSYDLNGKKFTHHGNKGLLFIGAPGCGKSTLMYSIMAILRNTALGFSFYGSISLSEKYSEAKKKDKGSVLLDSVKGNALFEELGQEKYGSNYGSSFEPMQEILHHRSERMNEMTHICTNLSLDDIDARYGSIIGSRISQMCNLFIFKDSDFRPSARIIERPTLDKYPRLYVSKEELEDYSERQRIKKLYEIEAKKERSYGYKGAGTRLREHMQEVFDRINEHNKNLL